MSASLEAEGRRPLLSLLTGSLSKWLESGVTASWRLQVKSEPEILTLPALYLGSSPGGKKKKEKLRELAAASLSQAGALGISRPLLCCHLLVAFEKCMEFFECLDLWKGKGWKYMEQDLPSMSQALDSVPSSSKIK